MSVRHEKAHQQPAGSHSPVRNVVGASNRSAARHSRRAIRLTDDVEGPLQRHVLAASSSCRLEFQVA